MWSVTWRGLLAHKIRVALTSVAIVLGVAFIAGTFVLTDSLSASFEGLFEEINSNIDVYVNPEAAFESNDPTTAFLDEAPTLDATLLDQVREVDGVAQAAGFIQGFAQMLDTEGNPIGGQGPPTFGLSADESDVGAITLRDGRYPTGPGEATVDAGSAEIAGFEVGGTVDILTTKGRASYTITGITGFGEEDSLLGATIATFSLEVARELFDKQGQFDQIVVIANEGVVPDELAARIDAILPDDAVAITAASEAENALAEVQGFLGFFNTVLLSFGMVALFVGAFIIANIYSIVVAQRTREFALLRALGAKSSQVTRSVLAEAAITGLVSSLIGLGLGLGLAAGLRIVLGAFGLDFPAGGSVIKPRTAVVAIGVGLGITMVSALLPALRAARVAPVEAMRGLSDATEGSSRVRTIAGGVLTAAGVGSLAAGLIGSGGIQLVGVGALLTMVGVSMLAPLIAGPATGAIGNIQKGSVAGMLARENARRNPKRTASTASALMIGLALVSFVTILAASITGSVNALFDEQFRSDFIISSSSAGPPSPMPSSLANDIRNLPGIDAASGIRIGVLQTPDVATGEPKERQLTAMSAADIPALIEISVQSGDVATLGLGEFFALAELAEEQGWEIGDVIPMTFVATGTQQLTLTGTYASPELLNGTPILIDNSTHEANTTSVVDFGAFASLAEGADLAATQADIEALVAEQAPGATVLDQATFREEQDAAIGQLLNLMIVLLLLAIFIALIGVAATMALSVFERTRELGLLRAVGMTRGEVQKMVRREAGIVSAFGALLGVAVGSFFGWAVVRALRDDGLEKLVFPPTRLVIYVVVAAIAGVIAGSIPAYRASRLDVLEAVSAE